MNKIFKKGLILFIITFIGLMVYLWFDDSLTPLSKEILEYEVKHQTKGNGNVYIWCFSCKTDDVYKAGSDVVQQANELIISNGSYEDFDDGFERLKFPNEDLVCGKFDGECDVFKNSSRIDHKLFLADYAWVVNRYHEYLSFNYYTQQVVPDYLAPFPRYRNLIYAQNIYHLSLISNADVLNNNQLVDKLTDELIATKRVLSKADELIQRMILVVLVSENIEFVSQLLQQKIIESSDLTNYTAELSLSTSHHDLTNALNLDFVMMVKKYINQSDFSQLINKKNTSGLNKAISNFLLKFAYKPNISINYITDDLARWIELTTLSSSGFYSEVSKKFIKDDINQFRNYLGHHILNGKKAPEMKDYTARVHSLHNKMLLLKSLIHYGSFDEINKNLDSDDFSFKSVFNDELPYFDGGNYCFGTLEGISTRPKDLCLRVL